MTKSELQGFLDEKAEYYETLNFIESDPIQIPHLFSKKEDIEISGFLAASIAWGQRKTIIRNARFLMEHMDMAPYDFISHFEDSDLDAFANFKHRTFNFDDLKGFFTALQNIYRNHGGLESVFATHTEDMAANISNFKKVFFKAEHLPRTHKHVSDPLKGSAAKRINMYLRWMVRSADKGVDFGIWNQVQPQHLYLPLDVHTANVSRQLGILKRKQNDWKALNELMTQLRSYDATDPVKYDFALFGLGVFEGFGKPKDK
ncbi:TIGR02757 family protein [bacterium SCSIO 12643]|nr:TIGR02757 family protein [bacterium SCSIO 12643]